MKKPAINKRDFINKYVIFEEDVINLRKKFTSYFNGEVDELYYDAGLGIVFVVEYNKYGRWDIPLYDYNDNDIDKIFKSLLCTLCHEVF